MKRLVKAVRQGIVWGLSLVGLVAVGLLIIGLLSEQPTVSPVATSKSESEEVPRALTGTASVDLEASEIKATETQPTNAVNAEELSCPEPVNVDINYLNAPARRIAFAIVNQWGLKADSLEVVSNDRTRDLYWGDSPSVALSILSRGADWTWYRDGAIVRFIRRDDPILKSARLVATQFDLKVEPTNDGVEVSVDSDLEDRREIRVTIGRKYFEKGNTEAYSIGYGRYCGLAAQWRVPKHIPIDDEAWKASLVAHHDKVSSLGGDLAFDIGEISDQIHIRAMYGWAEDAIEAKASIHLPLTVSIRSESNFVGPFDLAPGGTYVLRKEAPIMPVYSFHKPLEAISKMVYLKPGTHLRVEAVESGKGTPFYLATVGGRTGWINSIALLGVVIRASTLTDEERKAAELHQTIVDKVFDPCFEHIYQKIRNRNEERELFIRMEVIEGFLPLMREMVSELVELEAEHKLLFESKRQEFYRDVLAECKFGADASQR